MSVMIKNYQKVNNVTNSDQNDYKMTTKLAKRSQSSKKLSSENLSFNVW